MTAINVVRFLDRVHVVSDGAAIDSVGRLAHTMHKVTPLPHLNAVIGVRGTRSAAGSIVDAITSGASSYDDLHSRIGSILRGTFEPARRIWEAKFGPHVLTCDVIVAGWSETKGPHAYMLCTNDAVSTARGLPSWEPIEINGTLLTPSDSRLAADFSRLQAEFDNDAAVALIERQRAIASPAANNPTIPGPRGVGCFVQLTTIREHRIETRILKRWSDPIGEPIRPAA